MVKPAALSLAAAFALGLTLSLPLGPASGQTRPASTPVPDDAYMWMFDRCHVISARASWQEISLSEYGSALFRVITPTSAPFSIDDFTAEHSWTIDERYYERVGPEGHSRTLIPVPPKTPGVVRGGDPYSHDHPYGALLLRGERVALQQAGENITRLPEGLEALEFRINDRDFVGNAGSLIVCTGDYDAYERTRAQLAGQ